MPLWPVSRSPTASGIRPTRSCTTRRTLLAAGRFYGGALVIGSTYVVGDYQGQGIGQTLYRNIIESVDLLISDWEHSPGALALWERLRMDLPFARVMQVDGRYFARGNGRGI